MEELHNRLESLPLSKQEKADKLMKNVTLVARSILEVCIICTICTEMSNFLLVYSGTKWLAADTSLREMSFTCRGHVKYRHAVSWWV